MPTMIDSLFVNLGLNPADFEQGQKQTISLLQKIEQQAEKTNKTTTGIGKVLGESFDTGTKAALGFFAVVSAGVGVLGEMAIRASKADLAIGQMAKNVDMSVQKYATWENAARAGGSSKGAMDAALGGVTQAMVGLDRGQNSQLMGVLNQLHLGYKNADGSDMKPDQFLMQLAGKFQNIDPRSATFLGTALHLDPTMISFLEKGPAAIQQLLNANQSNDSPQATDAANALTAAFGSLETQVSNLDNDVLVRFGAAMDSIINHTSAEFKAFDDLLTGKVTLAQFWQEVKNGFGGGAPSPTPPGAPGVPGQADQKSVLAQGMAFFQSAGWSYNQSAGIMANAAAESTFNPNADSVDPKTGMHHRGLFQWDATRWAALVKWAGTSTPSAAQQMQFANMELQPGGSEAKAGALLRGTSTAFGAGVSLDNNYERPGDGLVKQAQRGFWAGSIANGGQPIGLSQSVQTVMDQLRYQQSKGGSTTVTIQKIDVNARSADAKDVGRHVGKSIVATISAARSNTGLN